MRVLVAIFIAIIFAGPAAADSGYSNVHVRGLKAKSGAVVGAVIKMRLSSASRSHNVAWVGLMPSRAKLAELSKADCQDPKSGKWIHHFETQTGMESGEVRELELKIHYDDAPHLVPGEKYQLATTWGATGATKGTHVFGPQWTSWGEPEITLPERTE